MIKTALELLVTQLNLHLGDAGSKPVTLGNIAQLENQDSLPTEASIKDKVVLSLVNLEEEKTMKNGPIHKLHNGRKELAERPVHLNMFLLFSANLTHYDLALERLSQILLFFQSHRGFDFHRHNQPEKQLPEAFNIQLDLHTLSFQEINDLWGSLGGKQVPFVMYKARLLRLEAESSGEPAQPITAIDLIHGQRN
ncbi:MAG: DUF4255 domain-containing protein [endosymbiont of Escarpia spicata]|uniref:DUF4255 domain-containing protein n=1 Tax=endosymbiont of Escarpia spicata TaxID=2200908 RepID=A0A370DKM5_9GAMM|nr:MAG: DUF4255 domain-containing protein [endosymbiont of Escarpia spicata]